VRPTLSDLREAHIRIRPHVVRTPLLSRWPRPDLELLLKPESLQATGAFKLRGAFSLMTTLAADIPGVVTHSSGNHAQAVARAGKVLGFRTVVVMPSDAPALKRARTEADGAEVITVGPDSEERAQKAREIAAEQGLVLVPPYDHALVMAGQGTAALEMLEDVDEPMDTFYCPVSGGGLLSGCAIALSELSPQTKIVGVEPETGDDTQRSLQAGRRVKVPTPRTVADGLKVRTPGKLPWTVISQYVERIALVNDEELFAAMAWALDELRLVLEPSGAASLAAALREGKGRCGVLLSGGNLDPTLLRQITGWH
jgi:threonine dehydratase